jgi:two-component system phosphate regulon sensor histidine kinase PhoR
MQPLRNNSLIFFYLLVGYIFASFIWWSYLLYEKNESLVEVQTETAYLKYLAFSSSSITFESFKKTEIYSSILEKHDRQKWMILGEGSVFMLLLVFGTFQLFRTFNKEVLLARQQNNFLLSITHELKSPLASIKLSLQTLEKRVVVEEKYQKLISNSLDDVDRLQSLVDNILFAARMENHSYLFEQREENISDLVEHLIEKFRINIGNSRSIHVSIQPGLEGSVDKEAIRSAFINVLENAYKYSSLNSLIQINFYKKENSLVFEVKDEGKGIALHERQNIFQKFYRIGNEETRNTKGTGLGLFIVKKVIESHNGKIVIEDNLPKGTVFKIYLPTVTFNISVHVTKKATKEVNA